MNSIHQLHNLGQSIWYDNIQRSLLENGALAKMIRDGDILGVTSNPSIFSNAIARSHDYDAALQPMAWAGWKAEDIFYQLAIEDIRAACDLFLPVYKRTQGSDGYVSLEVSPALAHNTSGTVKDARRLWKEVNRPNLMIKIPATLAGLPAITQVISEGINVNVTLIFSISRYEQVMEAYLSGLEQRSKKHLPLGNIASVASFFVSRMDTKVDALLQKIAMDGNPKASQLYGKAAIANTRLAFSAFEKTFFSPRFEKLQEQGARIQRPLWASTSTKNPAYRDVIYVEELIAPHTVNTVPPQTLDAFRDHGVSALTLKGKDEEARKLFADLEALGVSLASVTQELEEEGVKAFTDAFTLLLDIIESRSAAERAALGKLQKPVARRIRDLAARDLPRRIAEHDPAVWSQNPADHPSICERLGWLEAPARIHALQDTLPSFIQEVAKDGLQKVLLLGMGGSSLAPEVISLTYGNVDIEFAILDSTDPAQVLDTARRFPPRQTLYIVSSKSGGTSEVNAFLDYFWSLAEKALGKKASSHFIAITDPGTTLEKLALERNFRQVFLGEPTVGGRFSALSPFGLVPAALMGVDLGQFAAKASAMMLQCAPSTPAGRNPGLVLGAILGEAAVQQRDKMTILADPMFESLGSWMEQLIAESTGKNKKGIVPVDIEPVSNPRSYSKDRLFIYLRQDGSRDEEIQGIQKVGQPVLVFQLALPEDLASQFYLWGYATAVACAILGVNGFDQPDVQDNKTRTQQKIQVFKDRKELPDGNLLWEGPGGKVFGNMAFEGLKDAASLKEVVFAFLRQSARGDYLAINAYLPRNEKMLTRLQKVRSRLLKRTRLATTLGFGPRFLHSTGQLHKGGADNGIFLQITCDPVKDADIPGQGITFGNLERAQALGDLEALLAREKRAIRVHLDKPDPTLLVK